MKDRLNPQDNGASEEQHDDIKEEIQSEIDVSYKELSLLNEVISALNTRMELDEILQIIIDGMTSVFNYYSSGIYLLSDDGKYLEVRNFSLEPKVIKKIEGLIGSHLSGYKIPLFEGSLFKEAIEKREPIITTDIVTILKNHTDRRGMKALAITVAKLTGLKSGVGVPLIAGDKVVGMLGASRRDKSISEKDAKRLIHFANQAGLAIEKARLYEKLKDYSENLEQIVEDRTRELKEAQDQLRLSEKLAAIGQLAAGFAHEINNPLTNILLDAELLYNKGLDDGFAKEKLNEIVTQVEAAAKITKNLLEFGRESEIVTQPVDIIALLNKTLKMLSFQLTNIQLEKDFEDTLPEIEGDLNPLQQVFVNIITNAIQAMQHKGILKISAKSEDKFVRVDISDTGPGISDEDRWKIFNPFFTTKKVGEGTGLGLSICLGIVEKHMGRIDVDTKRGEGSTFTVRLPMSD